MYRTADQTAKVRDLEEEIERLQRHIENDADADQEREKRFKAELHTAQRKLRQIRTHRVLTIAGVVAGIAGCCLVIFLVAREVSGRPDHEHVEWNGQPALQNECESSEEVRSNTYCRDEAIAECRGQTRVRELNSAETFHAAYTITTMSCSGNPQICTPIITHYPARYTYVFTYQCKAGPG